MPIEQRPKFKLGMLTRDAQPLGSKCYWFQAGESFGTIASKVNLSPQALIRYNFGTSDAAEVNWYLREYIGYVRPTQDGKNWMFDPGRNAVRGGRKFIYVPLSDAERRKIVRRYHDLIVERMKRLRHDFGDPKPSTGLPSFPFGLDPGGRGGAELEYLNALVGYAEVIRALVWPGDYAAKTGRDYLEKPPELPHAYPKRQPAMPKPRGKGYGKGYDAAIAFWEQTIENPPEVRSVAQLRGVALAITGPIRIRVPHELNRTDARDLFNRLKKLIEDERRRFHGTREPYIWSRP